MNPLHTFRVILATVDEVFSTFSDPEIKRQGIEAIEDWIPRSTL